MPMEEWNTVTNHSVTNYIGFELRNDTDYYYQAKPFKCTLFFSIKYYSSKDQEKPTEINHLQLVVNYDTATGSFYSDFANYQFNGGFKVVVVIDSIFSPEYADALPAIFRVTNKIIVERTYLFNPQPVEVHQEKALQLSNNLHEQINSTWHQDGLFSNNLPTSIYEGSLTQTENAILHEPLYSTQLVAYQNTLAGDNIAIQPLVFREALSIQEENQAGQMMANAATLEPANQSVAKPNSLTAVNSNLEEAKLSDAVLNKELRVLNETTKPKNTGFDNRYSDAVVVKGLTKNDGKIELSWGSGSTTPVENDIEWTYVDINSSLAQQSLSSLPVNSDNIVSSNSSAYINIIEAEMKNNASRVTLTGNSYSFNLPYQEGFVFFRIRSVGYKNNVRQESAWTYVDNSSSKNILGYKTDGHEKELNWQYNATFSEGGKRKEVISYFDATLRNRQTVTINNSIEDVSVVAETIYDNMGRPTANILPAPTLKPSAKSGLSFYSGINQFKLGTTSTTTQPSNYEQFGYPAGACNISAMPLDNGLGAAQYYSPNNALLSATTNKDIYAKNLPNADGYPFAVTQYEDDNTGRIKRQGGVGPSFQIGSGHETKNYYAKPMQKDLDRLFGMEVGNASHYLKNMVIDPNGQASVSYIDANGKTIATALAGVVPNNVAPLASSGTAASTNLNQNLIQSADFVRDATNLQMTATATFVPSVVGLYKLNYNLDVARLLGITNDNTPIAYCNTCYYDLTVSVLDECGVQMLENKKPFISNPFTISHDVNVNPDLQSGSLSFYISEIGAYHVTYTLQLTKATIQTQEDYYIDKDEKVKQLKAFFIEELNKLDLRNCYNDCKTCKTLGTVYDPDGQFATNIKNYLKTKKYKDEIVLDVNSQSIKDWIADEWQSAYQLCSTISCTVSPCEEKLMMLKEDVRPGGQYALYSYDESKKEYAILVDASKNIDETNVSILSKYKDAVVNNIYFIDKNGVVKKTKDLSQSEFIEAYIKHPDWVNEYVKLHPEYCSYEWCVANESIYVFDKNVRENIEDASEAIKLNYYENYNPASPPSNYKLLENDPFFNGTGKGVKYRNDMFSDLANLSDILKVKVPTIAYVNAASTSASIDNQPAKDINAFIDWLLYFKPTSSVKPTNNTQDAKNLANSWSNKSIASNCRSLNRQWDLFKKYYFQLKTKYEERIKIENGGCSNCYIGNFPDLSNDLGNCFETANLLQTVSLKDFELKKDDANCSIKPFKNYAFACPNPCARVGASTFSCSIKEANNKYVNVVYKKGVCPKTVTIPVEITEIHYDDISGSTTTVWTKYVTFNKGESSVFLMYEWNQSVPYCCVVCDPSDPGCPLSGDILDVFDSKIIYNSAITVIDNGPPNTISSSCHDDPRYQFYINKIRRFNDYVNMEAITYCQVENAPTDNNQVNAIEAATLVKMQNEARANLKGAKANWINVLRAFVEEENQLDIDNSKTPRFNALSDYYTSTGVLKINQTILDIADDLYDIAVYSIDHVTKTTDDLNPYRNLITGSVTGHKKVQLHSFAEVFDSYFPSDKTLINNGFNEYLLNYPYFRGKVPITANPLIADLNGNNYDLCSIVFDDDHSLFKIWSADNASTDIAQFHTYLKGRFGDDYILDVNALTDLQTKSSVACAPNRVLNDPLVVPVAFLDTKTITANGATTDGVSYGLKGLIEAFNSDAISANLSPKLTYPSNPSLIPNKTYRVLLTNYINLNTGFVLAYDDYFGLYKKGAGSSDVLYNRAITPEIPNNDFACTQNLIDLAYSHAGIEYDAYIKIEREKFRNEYVSKCLYNNCTVNLEGDLTEYHYTLYYYDQAGNLVKTIPPAGVQLLKEPELSQLPTIKNLPPATCTESDFSKITAADAVGIFGQVSTAIGNSQAKAIELWLFQQGGTTRQVRFVTPDHHYFFQAAIANKRLWVELYTLIPDGSGQMHITLTNQAFADISGFSSLQDWVHLVAQTQDNNWPMADGNHSLLDIYYNGTKLTTVAPTGPYLPYPFDWTIEAATTGGGTQITVPANDFTCLKHLRVYNRKAKDEEVFANFLNVCLSPVAPLDIISAPLEVWGRFNKPDLSTPGVVSTIESAYHFVVPDHSLPTNYYYNSQNQVVKQTTPDAGKSEFWYDRLGRMAVSQNAEQATKNNFSYTLYDGLGRIKEIGEKQNGGTINEENARDEAKLTTWNASGSSNIDVTLTIYDDNASYVSWVPTVVTGTNLRKRVAATALLSSGNNPSQNLVAASYYAYDISGNVHTLWQYNKGLYDVEAAANKVDPGIKTIKYDFDLISGKVNMVKYQPGRWDQYFYKYDYDGENRLTDVYSGREENNLSTYKDAGYHYYLHGPLARTEFFKQGTSAKILQGLDYAYTLQGWVKMVNGQFLENDMGEDGMTGGVFGLSNRDAFGYSLGYFAGDYSPIVSSNPLSNFRNASDKSTASGNNLYNGNISTATYAIQGINAGQTTGYSYRYDQLNRLVGMNSHGTLDIANTSWGYSGTKSGGSDIINAYKEQISYDANGNILTYKRNGAVGKEDMDDLSYAYNIDADGRLVNNRLRHVKDAVLVPTNQGDIDNQGDDNYRYDNIGNLTKDVQGKISDVSWNVYGKIQSITKTEGTTISYTYDAAGQRISKKDGAGKSTFYVRDATGNVLGVYQNDASKSTPYTWEEQHLYGSGRLGMRTPMIAPSATYAYDVAQDATVTQTGKKLFELTNHLGNVLATISDKVNQVVIGTKSYTTADVVTAQDYYPFGMAMPGRGFQSTAAGKYRYGFNGQEKSDEIGTGFTTAQFWEYDSRIGRRWNVDPIDLVSISNYSVNQNNPLKYCDPLGNSPGDPKTYKVKKGDNLTKISKKVGVEVKDLVKMNHIKDKNKINQGDVLKINPEVDFKDNPNGGYSNPNKSEGTEIHIENTISIGMQFPYGLGAENELITSGKALNSIRSWSKVQELVDEGAMKLISDGKLTPGETYTGSYKAPTIFEYTKKFFKGTEDVFWTPIHVIGSFNLSMRVNADGRTTTICVYDSKTISSLSDNKLGQGSNKPNTSENGKRTPFSTQYLRFIWDVTMSK